MTFFEMYLVICTDLWKAFENVKHQILLKRIFVVYKVQLINGSAVSLQQYILPKKS